MWSKASTKEKKELIRKEVRKEEEEQRRMKAIGMAKQGRCTTWENVTERKLT